MATKKNKDTEANDEKLFLRELSKLSNKYRLAIDGCGCCGSPWISHVNKKITYHTSGGELRYTEN